MKIKGLGFIALIVMFLTGCQGGNKQDESQEASPEQQGPPASQQMPGDMQQGESIDVSDQEIEDFAEAARKIQELNMKMQQDVGQMIKDEGMETQRFNEIHSSQQSQQPGQKQPDISDQEMKQYQNILKKLENKQSDAQSKMQKAIENAGLTMQRYEQISNSARQDTALMKRLRKALQSSMQQQAPANP